MTCDGPPDVVVEVRAAEAAATAARAVPGVVRLQPGVLGLVRQFLAGAFERVTGLALPDIAGVDAELTPAGVEIEVAVVSDIAHQAATVAAAVQQAVHAAVAVAVDRPVRQVRVRIVDVDLRLG